MATIFEALAIAVQHHQGGRLQAAEQIYRQILQADPQQADALHLLGMIAYQVGQHEVAVETIGRAIALRGNAAAFHYNLAKVYDALRRTPESIASYRRALELQPDLIEAHNNLGDAFMQLKKPEEAIPCFRRALELKPDFAGAHSNLGHALRDQGKPEEAVACFRRALALQPELAPAHCNLGSALRDQGKPEEAAACFRRALELEPGMAEAHHNLGVAFMDQGDHDGAVACFRRALELKPDFAEAHHNLGHAFMEQRKLEEGIVCVRRALELKPGLAEARNNLGNAYRDQKKLDDAVACYRRALELDPDLAGVHHNLGVAFRDQGKLDDAVACFRRAVELKPDFARAYNNLGNALREQGRPEEAIASFQRAVELEPDYAAAFNNLGNAFADQGQLDETVACCHRALALDPDLAEAHTNLGNAHKDAGRLDEAIACYRRAAALEPHNEAFHSNLVHTLPYHPAYDDASIHEELRLWSRRFAEPVQECLPPHLNERDPKRRLRIGYVSPDFRDHTVGRNVLPVLERHDRSGFEVCCYASVARPDALTRRFQAKADVWRNIRSVSDQDVADLIRADRIDILVDLALHTAHHRLTVFARKPAPVQVAWAGYPGTTGLDAIDYRLTDPYLDPPGAPEEYSSEEPIRLPHSFWCYDPLTGSPPVNSLPALSTGRVTFGSLNNYCKVNEGVIALWSQVLCAVEGSRLVLLSKEGAHREQSLKQFGRQGVAADRIEWFTPAPRLDYLAAYHRIDLGLDTFPYNGHTTSLDSAWTGVPVVTLAGSTIVGRAGLSQLMNLGLPELIAYSPEQYVQIAAELAQDLPRLSRLRATLRDRMLASPLMNAPLSAQNIEAAYRKMWQHWCTK